MFANFRAKAMSSRQSSTSAIACHTGFLSPLFSAPLILRHLCRDCLATREELEANLSGYDRSSFRFWEPKDFKESVGQPQFGIRCGAVEKKQIPRPINLASE
jgi:hypothetical protein